MSNIKKLNELVNKMSDIEKKIKDIQSGKAIVSPSGVIIGYKISEDDKEFNLFEKHCKEDLYFYCHLCEDYHKKIRYKSSQNFKRHFLCQAPNKVIDALEVR